jgi:hypothetical protein
MNRRYCSVGGLQGRSVFEPGTSRCELYRTHIFVTYTALIHYYGSRDSSWYSAGLRTVWSGFRVPSGAGNFSLHLRVHTGSGAHPGSYQMGTRGSLPGRDVKLTTHSTFNIHYSHSVGAADFVYLKILFWKVLIIDGVDVGFFLTPPPPK